MKKMQQHTWFEYVLSSDPQTGSYSLGHIRPQPVKIKLKLLRHWVMGTSYTCLLDKTRFDFEHFYQEKSNFDEMSWFTRSFSSSFHIPMCKIVHPTHRRQPVWSDWLGMWVWGHKIGWFDSGFGEPRQHIGHKFGVSCHIQTWNWNLCQTRFRF